MVLILLCLFWNRNNLILKLHLNKAATLMKGGYLQAGSKLEVYCEW